VLHGHHRILDAQHGAHFVDAVTAGVDDDFTGDITLFRLHDPLVIGLLIGPDNGRIAIDFSAGQSRSARQRLSELGRVDIAIQRIPETTQQAVGLEQRVPFGTFGGIDVFKINPHPLGQRDEVFVTIHVILGRRQTNTS